ncbi:hypothetical protein N9C85_01145 [Synechococcus sp. AH-224-I15]|nr:hypothetical protein [Synechococcus sp. AH-224-I15]
MDKQQETINAVADGIAQNNATGLVLLARLHFGICMSLFFFGLCLGPVGTLKAWPIGTIVTAPGLLGFVDLKKLRGETS